MFLGAQNVSIYCERSVRKRQENCGKENRMSHITISMNTNSKKAPKRLIFETLSRCVIGDWCNPLVQSLSADLYLNLTQKDQDIVGLNKQTPSGSETDLWKEIMPHILSFYELTSCLARVRLLVSHFYSVPWICHHSER